MFLFSLVGISPSEILSVADFNSNGIYWLLVLLLYFEQLYS